MNKEEIYFKYGNEEVNAIEVLGEIAKIGFNDYYYEKQCKAVEIAVKLIDKLQKEIEELKGIKNGTTIKYIGKATYWREDKIEKYFINPLEIINNL